MYQLWKSRTSPGFNWTAALRPNPIKFLNSCTARHTPLNFQTAVLRSENPLFLFFKHRRFTPNSLYFSNSNASRGQSSLTPERCTETPRIFANSGSSRHRATSGDMFFLDFRFQHLMRHQVYGEDSPGKNWDLEEKLQKPGVNCILEAHEVKMRYLQFRRKITVI